MYFQRPIDKSSAVFKNIHIESGQIEPAYNKPVFYLSFKTIHSSIMLKGYSLFCLVIRCINITGAILI